MVTLAEVEPARAKAMTREPLDLDPLVSRVLRTAALVGILFLGVASRACASEDEAAYPLRLKLGESIAICSTGAIICPAAAIRCDDPTVVSIGGDARGPILTGAHVGTTLCSAGTGSGAGMRRVFRVTVVPKPPA